MRTLLLAAAASLLMPAAGALAQDAETPAATRQTELVRLVRQDCGSCHGIRLAGGLGPPLTIEAMRELPLDTIVSVIRNGRPGTPMPGWSRFLSEAEAQWIAHQLQAGFPQEQKATP